MSVQKLKGDIPPSSVRLTKEEAIEHQWRLVMNWTPEKDVWPFRYGLGIIAGTTALSAIYINNHYRTKLRLHNFGRFATYLPIAVLPTLMSALIHQQNVSNDLLIQKTPCALCVELRSGAIQTFFSVVYPTILAPLSSFMLATRHYTYDLPSLHKDPKGVFLIWQKLTRPVGNTLFTIGVLQALVAMFVTYSEAKSLAKVELKIKAIEEGYKAGLLKGMELHSAVSKEKYRVV